jgi:hypothetical protein
MNMSKWKWHVSIFDVLVGLAVLMILSALVMPHFVQPKNRAASRAEVPRSSSVSPQH